MTAAIESYITDHIEGRRKSLFVCTILHAISTFFKLGVQLRNFAFDCRLIKKMKVDIPVISIGNITAGGTGKTALIQKLGKDLSVSRQISVLLRGYRSEIEKNGGSLHLIEKSKITPTICGDEAYFLWKQLPKLSIFVGKNRCLNAKRAAHHEADMILLDDGMQYRRLHRDLELVMLHADDLYGKGFYLPRGYLRDSPKRLAKAHYIFINHVEGDTHFECLKKEVRKQTSAPIIGVKMAAEQVIGKNDEKWENLEGKRAAVFCGLGNPHSFFKTIETMGIEIAQTLILPDHVGPTKEQLTDLTLLAEEKGCELLLCSEKDWVKLPEISHLPLPIARLKASIEIVQGQSSYCQLLSDIAQLTSESKR